MATINPFIPKTVHLVAPKECGEFSLDPFCPSHLISKIPSSGEVQDLRIHIRVKKDPAQSRRRLVSHEVRGGGWEWVWAWRNLGQCKCGIWVIPAQFKISNFEIELPSKIMSCKLNPRGVLTHFKFKFKLPPNMNFQISNLCSVKSELLH